MREKIALVTLIVLMVVGILVVRWYFSTANTFVVVATKVDDRVGSMDYYTTIVYSGIRKDDNRVDIADTDDNQDEIPIEISQEQKLYLSDIREAYANKGSEVMTLDIPSVLKSESPQIYFVGEKKIGFFYVEQYTSASTLSKIISNLKKDNVDVVICLTKRSLMLGSFDGINCILCLDEMSPSETSEGLIGNCLVARAAEIGSIGALRIASSNLVSDKVYSPSLSSKS